MLLSSAWMPSGWIYFNLFIFLCPKGPQWACSLSVREGVLPFPDDSRVEGWEQCRDSVLRIQMGLLLKPIYFCGFVSTACFKECVFKVLWFSERCSIIHWTHEEQSSVLCLQCPIAASVAEVAWFQIWPKLRVHKSSGGSSMELDAPWRQRSLIWREQHVGQPEPGSSTENLFEFQAPLVIQK